ncbi:MAG TPA: hypothetical protein VF170_18395, partial [Planctomycetaceae bacterium]
MAGLSLVLVGCNADPSGPVPPGGPPEHLAWGRLLLMALFAAGVLLTAGAAVSVAFRKGGPVAGTLVASLVGMAVVGLCLMASWAVYVDRSEGARRAESQARMRHIGASLHPDLVSSPLTSTRADDFGTADGIGPSGVEATPGTRSEPLPEWVTEGTVRDGDRTRAVVSGQQFADPETALRDALAQAAGLVQWDFDAGLGHARRVDIPTDGHSVSVATGDWGSHSRIDYP